ncbi:hypothetical protein TNCV_1185001 [Trichonephila clavipes]|nr:hypothetical protein TNCV_1185001 [Trichonephila clavipes]
MAEEAKPYTAFVTPHGHYQFCVMPFGMKFAGSTFQKVMDQVLANTVRIVDHISTMWRFFPNLGNSTYVCSISNDSTGRIYDQLEKVQFAKKTSAVFRTRCGFRATFPRSRKG